MEIDELKEIKEKWIRTTARKFSFDLFMVYLVLILSSFILNGKQLFVLLPIWKVNI